MGSRGVQTARLSRESLGQLFATTRSRLPRSSRQSAQRHENVLTPGHPHHSLGGARSRAQSQAQGAGPGPGSWPRAQPGPIPGPGPRLRPLLPPRSKSLILYTGPLATRSLCCTVARNTEPALHGRAQHRTCVARRRATHHFIKSFLSAICLFCMRKRNFEHFTKWVFHFSK